jgi:hypothetical protein
MFKVRKWSNTNAKPYDVVYLDKVNNNQHYQAGVDFSTEAEAEVYRKALVQSASDVGVNHILDTWPTDGAVEE